MGVEFQDLSSRFSNRLQHFIRVNFNKVRPKQQICLSVAFSVYATPSLKLSQFKIWCTLGSGFPLKSADFLENLSSFQIRELLMIFSSNHFANQDSEFPLLFITSLMKKTQTMDTYILTFFLNMNLKKQSSSERRIVHIKTLYINTKYYVTVLKLSKSCVYVKIKWYVNNNNHLVLVV